MKKVWLLIICCYSLFFLLTPPLATPDENDHYETVYWLSKGIYPYQPKNSRPIKYRFTTELYDLVDLKMTSPKRNLNLPNYQAIKETSLKIKIGYSKQESAKFIPITLQSYQTPLFHLLAALFMRAGETLHLSLFWLFYFVRLSAALYYFAFICVSAKVLGVFFKHQSTQQWLLLFLAINPQVLRSGMSINPDIGQAFFGTLFLYLLLQWFSQRTTWQKTVALAVISGLTALNKFAGVFTAASFGLWLLLKHKLSSKTWILGIVFSLVFIALLFPWSYVNYQRYGTTSTTQGFYVATGHPVTPRPVIKSVILAVTEFRHTIMHYSGFLGASNDRYPFKSFFLTYTFGMIALSLIGIRKFWESQPKFRQALLLFYLPYLGFLYALSFFFKRSGMDWDIQGRYFLNGFFGLSLLLPFGITQLLKTKLETSAKILGLFSLWHYWFTVFFVVIPGYYV